MEELNKELHPVCATAIIYRDDGKYLITRRGVNNRVHSGRWLVPGGALSTDDYTNEPAGADQQWTNMVEKALRREIREEIGVEIGKPEYLCDITFVRKDGVPVLVLSFFAPLISGDVQTGIDEDVMEAKWVNVEEAAEYDLVGDTLKEIQMADAILKSRDK